MLPRVSLRWFEKGLLTLGLLLMGLWFKNETDARASHSAEAKKLEATRLGGAFSDAPGETLSKEWRPETLARGVFGRIQIPRLGISALITEGTGPEQLERAVGHVSTTVFPGQAGNCALAGHRGSFLRGLGNLRKNDVIRIDTLQDTYTYVVEWGRVVRPHRAAAFETTEVPSLTLVTGDPFHPLGSTSERFVVRAKLTVPTAWVAR
jgi:sortase A